MAIYESITYSRQQQFSVEKDLQCNRFELEQGDSAAKMAYHLCKDAALIGEFIISQNGKEEILKKGQSVLELLCSGKENQHWIANKGKEILDKRVLATACVLLTRSNVVAAERERRSDPSEVWPPILEGLGFPEIAKKTGCSEQTARNYLCDILEETIDFFTEDGKKYYNTLRLHALAPEGSIQNLYNLLYAFYHENLECVYEPGSNVASMFVEAMCKRWDKSSRIKNNNERIQSDWVASSQRELFLQRPRYMAALCDALLERIDWIVQGDMTKLDNKSRWDKLLRNWYQNKTETERRRMLNERKSVVRSKIVDKAENIRPEYSYEDGKLCICVPGIRLPEIRQAPVLQFYQNNKLICEKKLPIYGSELLYHTRSSRIVMDQEMKINWKMMFLFEVRILAGEREIYRSGRELFRNYLCFTPGGKETRLIRCEQQLRLITRKTAKLVIDDPQKQYHEENTPYRCIALRTETVYAVTLNGDNILEEAYSGGTRLWAYLTPEADSSVCARNADGLVMIYNQQPMLHVRIGSRAEGKNFQIMIDGEIRQLYEYQWKDGCFQILLPGGERRCHDIWLKDFETGTILFQRRYAVISGLVWRLDKPFYMDRDEIGKLFIETDAGIMTHRFCLEAGLDTVSWQMYDLRFELEIPKVKAELGGKNAFLLPEHMWHDSLKNSVLTIRTPEGVRCEVVFDGKFLQPDGDGRYEIGTELVRYGHSTEDAMLGLLISYDGYRTEEVLTMVHCQEALLSDPVVQEGRRILWRPQEEDYIGGKDPVFRIELENDQGEPWNPCMGMRSGEIERRFPCRTGTYGYTIWLTNRKVNFTQLPDRKLLEGEIYVEDPPEERFRNKHIILTHAYYYNPQTDRDTYGKMHFNGALVDHIRYVKTEADTHRHIYTGYLYFHTKYRWERFSETEDARYMKINPIFFSPTEDGHLCVWHDVDGDDENLELNLKPFDEKQGGIQILSRKDAFKEMDNDPSKERKNEEKYRTWADSFRFIERSDI